METAIIQKGNDDNLDQGSPGKMWTDFVMKVWVAAFVNRLDVENKRKGKIKGNTKILGLIK